MIIDDQEEFRVVYENFMEGQGHEYIFTTSPQEGWQLLEKEPFDLLITDLNMPYLDGDELVTILRKDEKFKNLPIVLASGCVNNVHRSQVARDERLYLIEKPFEKVNFRQIVSGALESKEELTGKATIEFPAAFKMAFANHFNMIPKMDKFELPAGKIKEQILVTLNFENGQARWYYTPELFDHQGRLKSQEEINQCWNTFLEELKIHFPLKVYELRVDYLDELSPKSLNSEHAIQLLWSGGTLILTL